MAPTQGRSRPANSRRKRTPAAASVSAATSGAGTAAATPALEDLVAANEQLRSSNEALRRQVDELAAAREEKDRLAALVNSISDEVWFAGTDGRVTLANPAAAREFRLDSGRVDIGELAASLEVLRPDGSPREVSEAPALRALRGEVVRNHENIVRTPASGELRYRQVSAAPVRDASGNIIGSVSVARDVTDQRRAEDALRKSERLYRAIGESIDYGVWVCEPDGRNIYASESFLKLVGLTQEQCSNFGWGDVLHPDDAERTIAAWKDCVRTGGTWDIEHRYRGVDGRWHPILARGVPVKDERGEIVCWAGINLDISEHKRAEEAVRQAHLRTTAVLESIADAFYSLDEQWRFVTVNPAAERAPFGRPAGDLLGKVIWDLFPAIVGTPIHRHYLDAMEKGTREHYEAQSPLNGRWYEVFMVPRVGGLDVYLRDIDERKKAEEALREQDRRKNEFLAVLSHELRNPLAPISNSLFILDRAAPEGEHAQRARAVIVRQVGHLVKLVDDLLDVTRITRGKIQIQRARIDLAELLRRTVEDYRFEFSDAGVELETRLERGPVWASADAARVAQIVGNLLRNAAKFTGAGGRVTLTLDEDLACRDAVIRVSDTGIGISRDVLPQLFQPFTQADTSLDRSRGGLGLGLALVKGLVELHGGSVLARSDGIGKGSEFTVRLPILPGSTVSESAGPVLPECPARRVLIVEDNVDAAEMLRTALTFGGHAVEVAHDGPGGLVAARRFRPDIVLCDVGLPGMTGYDVARAFRSDPTLGPVYLVALTGYALPEDLAKAREAGFDLHLAKPPDLDLLARVLAAAPSGGTRSGSTT
jgi:PAS domain S-box-containing protein